jgi:gamma-glutamyl:cysteine ligase YbdK (ATP-grasp superfamily)
MRSPLAAALADMEAVRRAMAELADDLMLRVALVAAAPKDEEHRRPHPAT